ncbi:MAG: hypothetical protein U5N85_08120 [Arcicella sp.]|nr:hypothetical protein [Arcicella sp.]
MSKKSKDYHFFNGLGNISFINRSSFSSFSKRINVLFLLFFSSLLLNIEAKNIQQIPASKLKVVVANGPKSDKNKAKAKRVKTKIKKAKAVPKDTISEIDPTNAGSPLYNKN